MVLVFLGIVLFGFMILVNLFVVKCRVWFRCNGGYLIVVDFFEVVCKVLGIIYDVEYFLFDIFLLKDF